MKTPLLKSNLLFKPSIVLASAVLTAASFFAPFARAADYLMPQTNGVWPVDPNPADPNSNTLAKPNDTIGLYDPYDLVNKEFRGYIGYEEGGKYYFGLKSGESILGCGAP